MGELTATPATVREQIGQLRPGDTLTLKAGLYREPLHLHGIRGTATAPIRIRGETGARVFGGLPLPQSKTDAAEVRKLARAALRELDPGIHFPGVYKHSDEGFIRFVDCAHIILEGTPSGASPTAGMPIEDCWPTAIAIRNSHHLEFNRLNIVGAAYAIQARGAGTSALRIDHCTWLQDRSEKFLWKELTFGDVHGNWGEAEKEADGLANSWRCFDGSFFNANDIAGGVEIVGCEIRHAFNGVHLFNDAGSEQVSVGLRVHGCIFSHIKDNPIEAETAAWDWWIHDNEFHNCHKWFSLELKRMGWIYIFQNRAWADDRPGPDGDPNGSGAVFKFHRTKDKVKIKECKTPTYVFHNSWALRSTLAQEGFVGGLHHFNNAIRIYKAEADGMPEPIYWKWTPFFGRRDSAEPGTRARPADFTRRWTEFNIRFFGDVTDHADYPEVLFEQDYKVEAGRRADPMFTDPARGELGLRAGSPCLTGGEKASIKLRNAADFELPGGEGVGWRKESWPAIRDLLRHAPGVPPLGGVPVAGV